MPMGRPNTGGGGGAFGVNRIFATMSAGGASINVSSQGWQWLRYTNKWLLSAQSTQTFARGQPYLIDDPLTNAGLEPLPNYPVVPADTNCIWCATDRNYHYFVLRVLSVDSFYRVTHDFSTWQLLSMPPFFGYSAGIQSIGIMPDTVLGDLLIYPVSLAGSSWDIAISNDSGDSWFFYNLPSIIIPSTFQAQRALMTTNSGELVIGFRDAIIHLSKPAFTPGLVFSVTPSGGVGTGGNSYTCFASAPDGRMAAGVNTGRLNYSLDDGLTWFVNTQILELSIVGNLRFIGWHEPDNYFYMQGQSSAVIRTLDFSDFEIVPLLSAPQSSTIITANQTILSKPGEIILTPDNTSANAKQFWSIT